MATPTDTSLSLSSSSPPSPPSGVSTVERGSITLVILGVSSSGGKCSYKLLGTNTKSHGVSTLFVNEGILPVDTAATSTLSSSRFSIITFSQKSGLVSTTAPPFSFSTALHIQ